MSFLKVTRISFNLFKTHSLLYSKTTHASKPLAGGLRVLVLVELA